MINLDSVLFEAAGLGLNETMSMVCPACNGGISGDGGFYVTRKADRYAYICHRASCGIKGYIKVFGEAPAKSAPITPQPRGYSGPFERFAQVDLNAFRQRFQIPKSYLLDIGYTPEGSYVFPLFDRKSEIAGHVVRYRGWRDYSLSYTALSPSIPKSKLYPRVKPMPLVFPSMRQGRRYGIDTLILVEDIVSALRIDAALAEADYQPSHVSVAALCGTNIGEHHLAEMQQDLRVAQLHIALDPDMWKKSLEFATGFSCLFQNGAYARLLRHDPKDYPEDNQALLEALGIE